MSNPIMSMDEAIQYLKTTRPTFYRWLRDGQIKGMKTGRQWRFQQSDLELFLKGEAPQIELKTPLAPLLEALQTQLQQHQQALVPGKSDLKQVVSSLLRLAIQEQAHSIHIEGIYFPEKPQLLIRFRTRDQLKLCYQGDIRLLAPLLEAIKQRSQGEGAFQLNAEESTQPCYAQNHVLSTLTGENLCMHVFHVNSQQEITLAKLQLPHHIHAQLNQTQEEGWGMIVCSGPSGSGKSTTQYAILNELRGPTRKIFSLEHTHERQFPWVQNVPDIGQHATLKAVLNADPDAILVPEPEDREFWDLALHSALNGHLILSSMHSQDSIQCLYRLIALSQNPYLTTEAIKVILNQRLMRLLCPDCRKQTPLSEAHLSKLRLLAQEFYLEIPQYDWQAPGCKNCHGRGYQGQRQLTESISLDGRVYEAIMTNQPAAVLRQSLLQSGWQSWLHQGWQVWQTGNSSATELLRLSASSRNYGDLPIGGILSHTNA